MDKPISRMDIELGVVIDEESYKEAEKRLVQLDPALLADRRSFWTGLAIGMFSMTLAYVISYGVLVYG